MSIEIWLTLLGILVAGFAALIAWDVTGYLLLWFTGESTKKRQKKDEQSVTYKRK